MAKCMCSRDNQTKRIWIEQQNESNVCAGDGRWQDGK